MDKAAEIFEEWFKLQKEFMENWTKVQREFMENWTDSTRKLQESFLNLSTAQGDGGPGKEMLKLYSTWFNTMADSSKIFTNEAVKIQDTWKASVEKQMEMSKEMFKNFPEFFKQGAGK